MKHQTTTTLLCSLLFFMLLSTSASAQLLSSNNLGIYPPGGPFNALGKFTSIGESGGTPGPTIDGCDFYGFRAQNELNTNVNLGITNTSIDFIRKIPTLLWGTNKRLDLISKGTIGQNGQTTTCGKRLGYFFNSSFNSNVFTIYGSATASGGLWQPSDERLKENIVSIDNPLDMIKNLNGVVYEYQNDKFEELNLPQGKQYGFLTQNVASVMPEAVRNAETDEMQSTEYQVMQYTQIIPVLTEAVKAQQKIIDSQQSNLENQQELLLEQLEINTTLEARLDRLEKMLAASSNATLPTLDNDAASISFEGVSLRQNRPNPFRGETTIEYTIPTEMTNAQLVIYDLNGKAISNTVLASGNGQMKVSATDFSAGVYFYTIESNGQTVARQKMVVK